MLIRVCGAMDNASAYGAEDSRFDPWQTRKLFINYFSSNVTKTNSNTSLLTVIKLENFLKNAEDHLGAETLTTQITKWPYK